MDEIYILARRVLLDALEAIGEEHRKAVILAGAQAIYLHVGEGNLAVAPYTSDADILLNPDLLNSAPPLEQALKNAGFYSKKGDSVGVWVAKRHPNSGISEEITVDLLVPNTQSPGKGRRATHLPGHDPNVARKVTGLEGALVDTVSMTIRSLTPNIDDRYFDICVAGPAALLIAKAYKIEDRQGKDRASDKDALDIYRILKVISTEELRRRISILQSDKRSAEVAERGIKFFRLQFSSLQSPGVAMLLRAVGPLEDHDEIANSCKFLANDIFSRIV